MSNSPLVLLRKILVGTALLMIFAFCVFGFLASKELTLAADRLPWQIGYGLVAGACVLGIMRQILVSR